MKKTLIAIASILAIVAGCQKTAIDQKIADGKIYASIEDGTKATLSTDGQDSFMVWSDKDTISLFDGTSNIKCSLTSEAGKKFGTFEPATTPEAVATYYAVAPYDTVATLVDGTLTVEYPSTIVYDPAKGPAEGGVNIMVAKSTSYNDIKFKNLCGYIKFDITGEAGQKVSKIFIYGEDDQPVNGKATVTFGEGGEPSVAFGTTETSDVTTVEFAEDVELSATPLTLTLAVAPVYNKGFHVTVVLADGRKHQLVSTTTIGRNEIVNMPAVVFSAVDVAEIAGTKYQSLAQAIAAANAATSDVEIKILSNCSSESALKIDNANAKVTIDLNDYNVMSKLEAVNTDFEIKDSGTKGMVMDENSTIRIYDKSNFTLNGGTIIATNGHYALYVESADSAAVNRPTATIVKGKILATDGTAMRVKYNNGVTFGTEATSADSDILVKGKSAIWSSSKSTVTIYKGTFEASETRLFYIGSSSTDVWNIHGGIFKSDAAFFMYNSTTMNTPVAIDGGKFSWATTFAQSAHTKLAISGGYFTADVTDYVKSGYLCVASTEETGYNYKVVENQDKNIIQVGTQKYETVAAAVDAANAATEATTIKLLQNINITEAISFTNTAAVLTLDLNGKSLVASNTVTAYPAISMDVEGVTLDIVDNSSEGGGKIDQAYAGTTFAVVVNTGVLNIKSGTICNSSGTGYGRVAINVAGTEGKAAPVVNVTGGYIYGGRAMSIGSGNTVIPVINISDGVLEAKYSTKGDNTYKYGTLAFAEEGYLCTITGGILLANSGPCFYAAKTTENCTLIFGDSNDPTKIPYLWTKAGEWCFRSGSGNASARIFVYNAYCNNPTVKNSIFKATGATAHALDPKVTDKDGREYSHHVYVDPE